MSLVNNPTEKHKTLLETFTKYGKTDTGVYQFVLLLNDKNQHFYLIRNGIKQIGTIGNANNLSLTQSFLDLKIFLFVMIVPLRDIKNYLKINNRVEFINAILKNRS